MRNTSRLVVAMLLVPLLLLWDGYVPRTATPGARASSIALLGKKGMTWIARLSGTSSPLGGVSCHGTVHCVAVGSHGSVLILQRHVLWRLRAGSQAARMVTREQWAVP